MRRDSMSVLALRGGEKVRKEPFVKFPLVNKEMEDNILKVLHSQKWGRERNEKTEDVSYISLMESEISKLFGVKYALGVANCTAALEIALRSVGVQCGDEVLVTPYSYIASATSIMQIGAIPVFVDIEEETWNMNLDLAEKLITPKTKAIVVVHFAGKPVDMDRILDISHRHNIKTVEDAAHAFGTKWKGRYVGTFGDAGCFSFQQSKNVFAGEGGLIVSNCEDVFLKAYSLHMTGRDYNDHNWYQHHCLGWNYRMTEFQGALVYSQLSVFEEIENRRRENSKYLKELLSDLKGIQVPDDEAETQRVYHLFTIRYLKDEWRGLSRKRFVMALNAEGIPCSEGYGYPIYKNPLFANIGGYEKYSELCSVAERICKESLWLSNSLIGGDKKDIEDISAAFHKICNNIEELVK